jgi:hypothetical protein
MIPVFTAKTSQLHDGTRILSIEKPIMFSNYLKSIEGTVFDLLDVTVKKHKSQRSLNQNAYYFGVVLDILSKHTGYEIDELHEILKFKFLRRRNEKGMEYVKSTAKLNTADFEDYLDKIKRWSAQELSCVIPDPNM